MNELLEYLGSRLDPVKMALYYSVSQVLLKFNYLDCEGEIVEFLKTSEEGQLVDIMDAVHPILRTALDQLLRSHGITAEGELRDLVMVAEALGYLNNWEDKETIFDMSNMEESPNIILCEMFEYVSGVSWLNYCTIVKNVEYSLINKIRELNQPLDEPSDSINLKRLEYIKAFVKAHKATWVEVAILDKLIPLETSLDTLLKLHESEIANIRDLSPKDAAIQLVGLFLMSDVSLTHLNQSLKDHLDVIYPNPNDLEKISLTHIAIQELLASENING